MVPFGVTSWWAFCYVVGISPRSGRIPTWWESALQSMSANVIVVVRESRGIGRHYGEQQFNPGVSLAGAVDLEALKHQVKAEPGQAGGAPAAGGYVIDTTENTFQAMVQTSATFPILLLLWIPTDDRLFPMARALGDAVNALNGQIQLSRIDISSNPSIAQALQVQGVPHCSR